MNTEIELKKVIADKQIQPRESICESVVDDYADRMNEGDVFPDVVVFYDGKKYWLADGFHRYSASKKIKKDTILATVKEGTKRDAIWYATGANAHHGNRLNNADKRKILKTILQDEEWSKNSNVSIAKHIGCSEGLVRKLIDESQEKRPTKKTAKRNGKSLEIETKNIGNSEKPKEAELPNPVPQGPIEEEPVEDVIDQAIEQETSEEAHTEINISYQDKCRAIRAISILKQCIIEIKTKPYLSYLYTDHIAQIEEKSDDVYNTYIGDIDIPTKQDAQKASKHFSEWIDLGRQKPTGRGSNGVKDHSSSEAIESVELWENIIGFPPTAKEGDRRKYAQELEKIVRIDGQTWDVVKEIIYGAKVCWIDNGIAIQSPLGLRKPVKSGACKKWESIWESYRNHPQYKPLRPVPKCPDCGNGLRRGNMTKNGRKYSVYMCPDHPQSSLKVGRAFMPDKLVRD